MPGHPSQVLLNHIRDKLPDMKARLNTLIGQAQQELNSFGDSAVYGDKNQVCHFFSIEG
jgi:dynamin 1-like protein